MATFDFQMDDGAIERLVADKTAEIQEQANLAVQRIVREVRDEREGQPADVVYDNLLARLKSEIPALQPNEDNIRSFAEAISEGTMRD